VHKTTVNNAVAPCFLIANKYKKRLPHNRAKPKPKAFKLSTNCEKRGLKIRYYQYPENFSSKNKKSASG